MPTGIKFFNWIGTMWRGSIELATPMLFTIGFLLNFLIGGISGVMLASPPIDFHAEDSYFLVAHLHYVLGGGSLFAIFAALYFWFPKILGVRLSERLGIACFTFMFVGFNAAFLPMHFMGLEGMPRRVYTYPNIGDLGVLNLISTVGAALIAAGVLIFIASAIAALVRAEPAGDDPWGGYSLEWATTSPPPEHNFDRLPPIRSERPVFDLRHPAAAEARS